MQDLPDVIGIGRASLFCYRTGTRHITAKSWLKLEAAERAAGISHPPAESPAVVCEEPADYGRSIADITKRLARIESMLARLLESKDLDVSGDSE